MATVELSRAIGNAGAIPIDGLVMIETPDVLYTAPDNSVFLQTGNVATDVASYPDASLSPLPVYNSNTVDISSEVSASHGVVSDGINLYAVDSATFTVYQYTLAGTYTGTSFVLSGTTFNTLMGMCWDGAFFYVVDAVLDKIIKFNSSWVYQADYSITANTSTPRDIAWDGTNFWVLDYSVTAIHKYSTSFVYQTGFVLTATVSNSTAVGLAWDGTNFWMSSESGGDKITEFTAGGTPTGVVINVTTEATSPRGLDYQDGGLWLCRLNAPQSLYEYRKPVGVSDARTLGSTDLYVRLK